MAGNTIHVEVTLEECRGDFNKMLRKFNRKLFKSGIIQDVKEKAHFVKPSQKNHDIKRSRKNSYKNSKQQQLSKHKA
jgi:ribosomal protein S21